MTDLTEIRRAVILAAGIGARLAHHTEHAPKPLLNVAGRPLIEHTLIALKDSGIQEVVVIA